MRIERTPTSRSWSGHEIAWAKGKPRGTVEWILNELTSLCSLAWAEMNLILTKVIWSFDLELGEGNKDDWSDQRVWLLHEKAPLYVKISPRGS